MQRAWRRLLKDRPTGLPAPGPDTDGGANGQEKRGRAGRSGYASAPRRPVASNGESSLPLAPAGSLHRLAQSQIPVVRDVQIVPPVPFLSSLSLGLFPLSPSLDELWQDEFFDGYADSIDKTIVKIEEYLERWKTWANLGRLHDGSKRMVCFGETVRSSLAGAAADFIARQLADEPDEVFRRFCAERDLVPVEPAFATETIEALKRKKASFVLCTTPDCSGQPGIAHLSLAAGSTGAIKEDKEERERREKLFAEQEDREEAVWRRPRNEHRAGCGHLKARDSWGDED